MTARDLGEDVSPPEVVTGATFRTSSFCANGGCVEVAPLPNGHVAVRDSKRSSSPLVYTGAEWRDFIAGVKNGEFDF